MGIEAITIDGANFSERHSASNKVIQTIRNESTTIPGCMQECHCLITILLVCAWNGTATIWRRPDQRPLSCIEAAGARGRFYTRGHWQSIEEDARLLVAADFQQAMQAEDPQPEELIYPRFCTYISYRRTWWTYAPARR
jgi:2-oxoisovalerate dehydrogenase E1 component